MAQQKITSNEITSVNNISITGLIQSNQIASISNTQIVGTTLPGAGQVTSIMLDFGSSTGNGAIVVPVGNTAQRPISARLGMIRYNTDIGVLENYTSQGWFKVSVPIPTISSISGTIYAGNTSTITINGSNFENTTGTVTFTISGSSSVTVSATPNLTGTQVSCLVPSGIYSAASAGTVVSVTYTNTDNGVSGPYSMTAIGLPTGGTISQSGTSRIHSFTTSGTLSVPTSFSLNASYLLVAGGGGAGFDVGGGGGAGGVISGTTTLSTGSYPISIGSGGGSGQTSAVKGSNGGNSTFSSYTAIGGGGGGSYPGNGAGVSGGSGGGAGDQNQTGGSGTSGQGYAGGSSAAAWGSGGGGGAGGAGTNGVTNTTVAGGLYLTSSISGSSVNYSGGGYGNLDGGTVQATGLNYAGTTLGTYGFGANGTGAPNNSPYSGNGGIFIISYQIT